MCNLHSATDVWTIVLLSISRGTCQVAVLTH